MLKKGLLSSGSRMAFALGAGLVFGLPGAASAQPVAGNTGCLIPTLSGNGVSTIIALQDPTQGLLYGSPGDGFNPPAYYCSGSSYALTSSVQAAVDSLKTQIAGLNSGGTGLSSVTTDATLTGIGTVASPLGLSAATQTAITTAQSTATAAQSAATNAQTAATAAQATATAAQSATNQLGQTIARNLGGGVTYDPTTGAVTAPAYSIDGSTYNNVGSALGAVDSNISTLNTTVKNITTGGGIKYFHASSNGPDSQAAGAGSVAIGGGALASLAGSVAIGDGSTAFGLHRGMGAFSAPAAGTATSVISVGAWGTERQVQNVAAGEISALSTDAVNGSQVYGVVQGVNAVGSSMAANIGAGATYDPATGKISAVALNVAGGSQSSLGDAIGAIDTATKVANAGVSAAFGGGATISANGQMTLPTYSVGATRYMGVAAALNALQSAAPVQYSTAANKTAANGFNASQNLTLVGANVGPVTLSNVARGVISAASTDAVNGSQLHATNQIVATQGASVAGSLGAGATYDAATGKISGVSLSVAGGEQSSLGDAIRALDSAAKSANGGLAASLGGGARVEQDGTVVAPLYVIGRSTFDNVGSALSATNNRTDALAKSVAANIGGGATYDPATGQMTAPAISVGGVAYNDVASAISAQGKLAVQYVPDAKGNPTATVNLVTASLPAGSTGVTVTGVAAGALSATSTDAVNGAQLHSTNQALASLGSAAVRYDATAQGAQPSITLSSPNNSGPVAIHNVAPGVASSDAATVGQLNQMGAALDSRLAQDEKEISKAKALARGAGAIAMATASLRYDDRAGRGSVGFGMGNYAGATALATGLNYNVTQALRVNANAAYVPNTRNVGFGLGATYTFW